MSELPAQPAASWQQSMGRVVLAVNPKASRTNRLAGAVEDNLRHGGLNKPVVLIPTVPGGVAANQEHFARYLEPGDVIVAVTGDGGFRSIGAAALHPDLMPHADKIFFTTVGGGDACDMQHALHGKQTKRSPSELLKQGMAAAVRPLAFQMDDAAHIAFSYGGFGRSGKEAANVNSAAYHNKPRILREPGVALHLLCRGEDFSLQPHWPDGGKPVELAELTVSISPCMARYGRFPVRHWDDDMFVMRVRPGFVRPMAGLAAFAAGRPTGTRQPGDRTLNFTPLQAITAQFDGEHLAVAKDTLVSVGRMTDRVSLIASPHMLRSL